MLTRFGDFDSSFAVLDELRRRMNRLWDEYDDTPHANAAWPRFNLFDTGAALVVTADVPGLGEKDLELKLNDGTLTVSGERKVVAPEGYSVHRQERPAFKFTRSFALPVKVDGERTTATVKDGVLTISLAKAAEAQPRQIPIKSK